MRWARHRCAGAWRQCPPAAARGRFAGPESGPPNRCESSCPRNAALYRGEQRQATFAGDLERLPQTVRATVESNWNCDVMKFASRIKYHVEHEPLTNLTFEVPKTVLTDSRLEWLLDGLPVIPATSNAASEELYSERRVAAGKQDLGWEASR